MIREDSIKAIVHNSQTVVETLQDVFTPLRIIQICFLSLILNAWKNRDHLKSAISLSLNER